MSANRIHPIHSALLCGACEEYPCSCRTCGFCDEGPGEEDVTEHGLEGEVGLFHASCFEEMMARGSCCGDEATP